jgi:hypothetical protein
MALSRKMKDRNTGKHGSNAKDGGDAPITAFALFALSMVGAISEEECEECCDE